MQKGGVLRLVSFPARLKVDSDDSGGEGESAVACSVDANMLRMIWMQMLNAVQVKETTHAPSSALTPLALSHGVLFTAAESSGRTHAPGDQAVIHYPTRLCCPADDS